MAPTDRQSRRTFLKRGLLAGGSLALAAAGAPASAEARRRRALKRAPGAGKAPNILVIVVDQMRAPAWTDQGLLDSVTPNLAALRSASVNFERHYTAANDCTPSRGALVTGLYSHQTRCVITGRSLLSPEFPTWGTFLRQLGYETTWWGKWHLNPHARAPLDQYGFSGGTYPSPNGSRGEGTEVDPEITRQFQEWFAHSGGRGPWCTTVSFVNPHDIAWWYRFTSQYPLEASAPTLVNALPPNFETPQELLAHGKPLLHHSLQETAARSFGAVPFEGPEAVPTWSNLMNTYLLLQGYVDAQIGQVLQTLASKPKVAANTVIVFTSDHGEYGGSHGMRGKGASAYEEAIRVPLYVYDPRGLATAQTAAPRTQLSSSVDVIGLLLSLASGSNAWRRDSMLSHLSGRLDLATICTNPRAPGRPWVLHATDEDVTEFATAMHYAEAPRHLIAIRSEAGKLGLYSNWRENSIALEPTGQELEFYDYSTPDGRLEMVNQVGSGALQEQLQSTLMEEAIPHELRAPLPGRLHRAQQVGMANLREVEEIETEKVDETRANRAVEPEPMPG